jgi:hypothetical protein
MSLVWGGCRPPGPTCRPHWALSPCALCHRRLGPIRQPASSSLRSTNSVEHRNKPREVGGIPLLPPLHAGSTAPPASISSCAPSSATEWRVGPTDSVVPILPARRRSRLWMLGRNRFTWDRELFHLGLHAQNYCYQLVNKLCDARHKQNQNKVRGSCGDSNFGCSLELTRWNPRTQVCAAASSATGSATGRTTLPTSVHLSGYKSGAVSPSATVHRAP